MAGFPPASSNQKPTAPSQVTGERGPISTGGGGIKASLKVKAAGTRPAQGAGQDKTVLEF